MPNQQGGVFRRDSCQSRLESLLSSQPSTPGSRQFSRRFFADGSGKSSSSRDDSTSSPATGEISLCEADRIELEYLKGFANNDEENDDQDGANKSLCVSTNLSVNTSKNTVYNSTMSHRGSITKFLLQQQSRNSSPVSGSRRGSTQSPIMGIQSGSSSRSSMSSFFGGSRRTSLSSHSKAKGSSKGSQSGSNDNSGESNSDETSEVNSFELEPELADLEFSPVQLLFGDSSRRESGDSTVVGSRWESGQSTVVMGTPKISRAGDSGLFRSMKDTDMLHLLAARLLQATRERNEDGDGDEIRESVV